MRLRIELDTNTKADENNSSGSRYHFIGFEQIENGNTNEEEMHEMLTIWRLSCPKLFQIYNIIIGYQTKSFVVTRHGQLGQPRLPCCSPVSSREQTKMCMRNDGVINIDVFKVLLHL